MMKKINLKVNKTAKVFTVLSMLCTITACQNQAIDKNLVLQAKDDFKPVAEQAGTNISYFDNERNALAVDAVKYKDQFAKVSTIFNGKTAVYRIEMVALTETDGESSYGILVKKGNQTKVLSSMKTNPPSSTDFSAVKHVWTGIPIQHGDEIVVYFNSDTNRMIPEGSGTAYSRGRWSKLTLSCQTGC